MKKLILLLVVLISLPTIAQDTIRLKHTRYVSVFSKSLRYPVLVEWWETASTSDCQNKLDRKDQFSPDPLLKNETNLNEDYLVGNREQRAKNLKGFDRGHLCPAAVNLCQGSPVQAECFYFSNMVPQYHSLNAGDWKSLETYTRETSKQLDSIHIWAGSVGVLMKIGKTSVPTHCWKVIYIKKTKTFKAFLFKNDTSKPDGYLNNEVTIEAIEELTGFRFKI